MAFLLLVVLSLVCLQRKWPAPPEFLAGPGGIALTWGVVGLLVLLAWLVSGYLRRALTDDHDSRYAIWKSYSRFRRWHGYAALLCFCLLVCFGGWGWAIGETFASGDIVVPGTDLVLLAPLFTCLFLSWAGYQPLEKALNEHSYTRSPVPFPGRWAYVALQARSNLVLVVAPLSLMILQQAILAAWPELAPDGKPIAAVVVGLLCAMFVLVPWFLRIFLGLQPLPPGPLRDRLLQTARRLRFRCNDILVWDTRFTIVNAMVAGPLPLLRYVILTDRMLVELAPEEIEAVFGHEVGHIKHRHLFFYFIFLLGSLMAGVGLWNGMIELVQGTGWLDATILASKDWWDDYQSLAELPFLALLGLYIFVVFGFLSRRCERQADLFGCRTVSTEVFVQALEKVAILNGISRDRPGWLMSWQHSTIARRVDFLQNMASDPAMEPRFQRRLGLMKWAIVVCLAVLCAALE